MSAVSSRTLTFLKWCYWILFTMAHLYICYWLFSNRRALAGILWLVVGFILLFIMYAVFFPSGDPESKWPPYISSCPDYLTLIGPNACVDYVGLHSRLKTADPSNPPVITDSTYVFDASGSTATKASRAQQYGLSWEGIV
jgi:hypothetical protein